MFPNFSFLRRKTRIARPSAARSLAVVCGLVILLAVAACVSDGSPTDVKRPQISLSAALSPADEAARKADEAARKAAHDELMRQRDSVRSVYKQLRDGNKDEYRQAKAQWDQYRKDWAERRKRDRNARVELLRCAPQPFDGDAEVIGPDGGALHIGPHSLIVPKGALDHEMLLVGTAPTGPLVQVQFGPHGLHFDVAAQLTLSYEHCMRPDHYTYRIVYVEDRRVLEFPPSQDDKTQKKVTAPIEHFSGYMIAY